MGAGASAMDGEGCSSDAEGAGAGASPGEGSAAGATIASGGAARRVGVGADVVVGVARGDAVTGGGTTVGVTTGGGSVSAVALGVGAGAERDSGTSGATGPCRAGCGCVSEGGGKRKSLTAAPAGAASRSAELRARQVERIFVAADMAGGAE